MNFFKDGGEKKDENPYCNWCPNSDLNLESPRIISSVATCSTTMFIYTLFNLKAANAGSIFIRHVTGRHDIHALLHQQ